MSSATTQLLLPKPTIIKLGLEFYRLDVAFMILLPLVFFIGFATQAVSSGDYLMAAIIWTSVLIGVYLILLVVFLFQGVFDSTYITFDSNLVHVYRKVRSCNQVEEGIDYKAELDNVKHFNYVETSHSTHRRGRSLKSTTYTIYMELYSQSEKIQIKKVSSRLFNPMTLCEKKVADLNFELQVRKAQLGNF